nr:PDZ domain-containing protein [Desulfuromonadales bacterium]
PDSPAADSGLKEGDIIIGLAGEPVKGLKDVSAILKKLKPGDTVSITFRRQGEIKTTSARLVER